MAILNFTFLLILALVIFAPMSAVNGLKCFKCTEAELKQLIKDGGECSGESVECKDPKEICSKMTNKGEGKETSKSRTFRGCEETKLFNETDIGKCQDKDDDHGGLFHVCLCNRDNCNGSGLLQPSSLSSIFILALIGAEAAIYQNQ